MKISDIISIISVLVSFYVFYRQNKYEKVQDKLNQMQIKDLELSIENKQRADIIARVVKLGEKRKLIRICNVGGIRAEKINIIFPTDFDWAIFNKTRLPFDFLEPGENFDITFSYYLGSKREHLVKLLWKEKNIKKEKETILTV